VGTARKRHDSLLMGQGGRTDRAKTVARPEICGEAERRKKRQIAHPGKNRRSFINEERFAGLKRKPGQPRRYGRVACWGGASVTGDRETIRARGQKSVRQPRLPMQTEDTRYPLLTGTMIKKARSQAKGRRLEKAMTWSTKHDAGGWTGLRSQRGGVTYSTRG